MAQGRCAGRPPTTARRRRRLGRAVQGVAVVRKGPCQGRTRRGRPFQDFFGPDMRTCACRRPVRVSCRWAAFHWRCGSPPPRRFPVDRSRGVSAAMLGQGLAGPGGQGVVEVGLGRGCGGGMWSASSRRTTVPPRKASAPAGAHLAGVQGVQGGALGRELAEMEYRARAPRWRRHWGRPGPRVGGRRVARKSARAFFPAAAHGRCRPTAHGGIGRVRRAGGRPVHGGEAGQGGLGNVGSSGNCSRNSARAAVDFGRRVAAAYSRLSEAIAAGDHVVGVHFVQSPSKPRPTARRQPA